MKEETTDTELVLSRMDQYFDAAKEVLEKYAPDVVDLGLNALRIEALSELFLPLILIIFYMVYFIRFFQPHLIHFLKILDETESVDNIMFFTMTIIFWIPSVFAIPISLINLVDLWAWVGIFYPELYAVHKFLL